LCMRALPGRNGDYASGGSAKQSNRPPGILPWVRSAQSRINHKKGLKNPMANYRSRSNKATVGKPSKGGLGGASCERYQSGRAEVPVSYEIRAFFSFFLFVFFGPAKPLTVCTREPGELITVVFCFFADLEPTRHGRFFHPPSLRSWHAPQGPPAPRKVGIGAPRLPRSWGQPPQGGSAPCVRNTAERDGHPRGRPPAQNHAGTNRTNSAWSEAFRRAKPLPTCTTRPTGSGAGVFTFPSYVIRTNRIPVTRRPKTSIPLSLIPGSERLTNHNPSMNEGIPPQRP